MMPVASSCPCTLPAASRPPERRKVKSSDMVMTSPSMPLISLQAHDPPSPVLARALPGRPRTTAEAICARSASMETGCRLADTITSMRLRASRGVLACTVVSDPSWPGVHRLEHARAPRHRALSADDDAIRRIRRLLRTRSREFTSPRPSPRYRASAFRGGRRTEAQLELRPRAPRSSPMRSSVGMKLESDVQQRRSCPRPLAARPR